MPGASKRRGRSDKQNQRGAAQEPPQPAAPQGASTRGGPGPPQPPAAPSAAQPGSSSQNPANAPTSDPQSVRSPSHEQRDTQLVERYPAPFLNKNVDFGGNAYNLLSDVSSRLTMFLFSRWISPPGVILVLLSCVLIALPPWYAERIPFLLNGNLIQVKLSPAISCTSCESLEESITLLAFFIAFFRTVFSFTTIHLNVFTNPFLYHSSYITEILGIHVYKKFFEHLDSFSILHPHPFPTA